MAKWSRPVASRSEIFIERRVVLTYKKMRSIFSQSCRKFSSQCDRLITGMYVLLLPTGRQREGGQIDSARCRRRLAAVACSPDAVIRYQDDQILRTHPPDRRKHRRAGKERSFALDHQHFSIRACQGYPKADGGGVRHVHVIERRRRVAARIKDARVRAWSHDKGCVAAERSNDFQCFGAFHCLCPRARCGGSSRPKIVSWPRIVCPMR